MNLTEVRSFATSAADNLSRFAGLPGAGRSRESVQVLTSASASFDLIAGHLAAAPIPRALSNDAAAAANDLRDFAQHNSRTVAALKGAIGGPNLAFNSPERQIVDEAVLRLRESIALLG